MGVGVGHRIAAGDGKEVWRARGQGRTGASEHCAVPHARACVESSVLCCAQYSSAWVLLLCGAPAGCSLARSLVLQRRDTERWLRALAFSLPTSTSSARGVVQFWLTRRPTPAAIYGHRHPGGVSGLALSSLLVSYSPPLPSAPLRFPIPSFSVCEHNNGVPVRPSRPIPYPKDTRPRFTS